MKSLRRSTRLRGGNNSSAQWNNLSCIWREQYMDLSQHSATRLSRCTRRLLGASNNERDQLRSIGLSFVALAITVVAASSTSRLGVPSTTQNELIIYIETAKQKNLEVNDNYNGCSAVELAAYHGQTKILTALLHMGCPLKKSSLQGNAIFLSVRNGQHASLGIILRTRTKESREVIRQEVVVIKSTGKYLSTFKETMTKGDTTSALTLKQFHCLCMSDIDSKKSERNPRKLHSLLHGIHPEVSNLMHWQKKLHWSFPTTDKHSINWLWHVVHRDPNTEILPDEMWLRIFSFFSRGWFASRKYETFCRFGGDVVSRNVIGK